MPSDVNSLDDRIETQWRAFEKYLCEPYKSNPERLAALQRWYNDLYARRESNGLELSSCRINHALTGRRFNAFCLNKQMYFSDDAAVLTLPYPRDANDSGIKSDQLVGIFLHDFATLEKSWRSVFHEGIEEINNSGKSFVIKDCPDVIFGELKAFLNSPGLPNEDANQFSAGAQLRISKDKPLADAPHHDVVVMGKESPVLEPSWNRFVIHVLHGPGTTYFLGNNENTAVSVPTGTTSSHFAAYVSEDTDLKCGALHEAAGDKNGRAILTPKSITPTPITKRTSGWRIDHNTPA